MSEELFHFEDFVLNRGAFELRRAGVVVPLQRIPLELLCLLVERRGQLVTRTQILERVWGKDVFVDSENSINTGVRKLRRALSDDPEQPRFVLTVPTKGYRFIAEVRVSTPAGTEQYRTRLPAAMVGRAHELASLLEGLKDAGSRHGRLFLIAGEPGIGKTRLTEEVAAAANARGMTILVGNCSEHDEAVAYLPFVEILENFTDRFSNPQDLRTALGDQGPELARLLPKLRSLLPQLPPPLELPPAQARRHLFNCVCDLVARICGERPILMILEDIHWADDSTVSLLDHLVQRLADLPLMLVGTYRDADLNVTPALARILDDLLRKRRATQVRLKRLSSDEVAAMLTSLSGQPPPASVASEMYAETAGNPFFVEELFRHLEEEDRLYDAAGQFRAELKIGELEAPSSVRLVVVRRLERLGDSTRRILAIGATIGRLFSLDLLQAASAAGSDLLLESIEEAEEAGLVAAVADSPKARYQFSHELIRQAVLGSVAAARRQRLHLEVAAAIERTYAGALDDYLGELAHHYRLGGDLAKAIDYLSRAADWAAARSALQQAIALATTGLELLAAMPNLENPDRLELALQMTLGSCGSLVKGWAAPEVERAYSRALELCDRTDRTPEAVRAMLGLYNHYARGTNLDRASALEAQLLKLAPTLDEPRLLARIHYFVGFRFLYSGVFESARHQLEQAVSWSKGSPACVPACAALALTTWNLGYPDRASKMLENAGAEARRLRDPYAEVMVADNACVILANGKDALGAKHCADDLIKKSTSYGFTAEIAFAHIVHAWADGCGGDPTSIDRLRECVTAIEAIEGPISRSWSDAWLAEVCLKFGRTDEAIAALEDGLAVIALRGEGFAESEICRLRGEAELQLGPDHFAGAASWFKRALDAARKRGARMAELRAAVSLARLLEKQHKRDEARAMLAEIYAWFTEGFDTADLKDARALLKELRRNSVRPKVP